jgi:hypothetical protein
MTLTGLRTAFPRQSAGQAEDDHLQQDIVSAILTCFPLESIPSDGPFGVILEQCRMLQAVIAGARYVPLMPQATFNEFAACETRPSAISFSRLRQLRQSMRRPRDNGI